VFGQEIGLKRDSNKDKPQRKVQSLEKNRIESNSKGIIDFTNTHGNQAAKVSFLWEINRKEIYIAWNP
jgi:hypothetical protein